MNHRGLYCLFKLDRSFEDDGPEEATIVLHVKCISSGCLHPDDGTSAPIYVREDSIFSEDNEIELQVSGSLVGLLVRSELDGHSQSRLWVWNWQTGGCLQVSFRDKQSWLVRHADPSHRT